MRERGRQLADHRDASEMRELLVLFLDGEREMFALGDVHDDAAEIDRRSRIIEAGSSLHVEPTHLAARQHDAKLDLERLVRRDRGFDRRANPIAIVGVLDLVHRVPRDRRVGRQPVDAPRVIRQPQDVRLEIALPEAEVRRVGGERRSLLALAQRIFDALAIGDVASAFR